MNENLPYDDELKRRLNDLPLPDEDIAWEDMKRRLEKDDDDKPIVLPVLKNCGGCGLLLLLLTIAGLFIVNPVKWFNNDKTKNTISKTDRTENNREGNKDTISNNLPPLNYANDKTIANADTNLNPPGITHSTPGIDTLIENKGVSKIGSSHIRQNKMQEKYIGINKQNIQKTKRFKKRNDAVAIKNNRKPMPAIKKINIEIKRNEPANTKADSATRDSKNINVTEEEKPRYAADTIVNTIQKGIQKQSLDAKKAADTVANGKVKNASIKQKDIYFSAGLGVHQLLPVAGQKK